ADALIAQLDLGRDRLLELNSYDKNTAQQLIDELAHADDFTPDVFMDMAFERFGVETEEHSDDVTIIRPGNHMVTSFPHLPDEGLTITSDRELALSRDDWQFLTWEHPMVTSAIDLILTEHRGK